MKVMKIMIISPNKSSGFFKIEVSIFIKSMESSLLPFATANINNKANPTSHLLPPARGKGQFLCLSSWTLRLCCHFQTECLWLSDLEGWVKLLCYDHVLNQAVERRQASDDAQL